MSKKKLKKKLRKVRISRILERSDLLVRAENAEYDAHFAKLNQLRWKKVAVSAHADLLRNSMERASILRPMNKEQIRKAVALFSEADEVAGDPDAPDLDDEIDPLGLDSQKVLS